MAIACHCGRPRKMTPEKIAVASQMYTAGTATGAQITRTLGVSCGTVYQHLDRAGTDAMGTIVRTQRGVAAYRRRRSQRRIRRTSTGTAMRNPTSAVQNFNTMVIGGSHTQTRTAPVAIVDHIGDLHGEANSDAVDGAASPVQSHPVLDSGHRPGVGSAQSAGQRSRP